MMSIRIVRENFFLCFPEASFVSEWQVVHGISVGNLVCAHAFV